MVSDKIYESLKPDNWTKIRWFWITIGGIWLFIPILLETLLSVAYITGTGKFLPIPIEARVDTYFSLSVISLPGLFIMFFAPIIRFFHRFKKGLLKQWLFCLLSIFMGFMLSEIVFESFVFSSM